MNLIITARGSNSNKITDAHRGRGGIKVDPPSKCFTKFVKKCNKT
jgi:hypothetical protein